MTPLTPDGLSRGGKRRLETQPDWERAFVATLAAHRRPLLKDIEETDKDVLDRFRVGAKSQDWLYFCIVGADGRTIRHTLPDHKILRRLKEVGGAIGFCGILLLPTKKTLAIYYRPLKKGTEIIEKLELTSQEIKSELIRVMHEEVKRKGLERLESR